MMKMKEEEEEKEHSDHLAGSWIGNEWGRGGGNGPGGIHPCRPFSKNWGGGGATDESQNARRGHKPVPLPPPPGSPVAFCKLRTQQLRATPPPKALFVK